MEKDQSKAKGGFARAEALNPERRKAIAKAAAEARWSPPKATHQGVLAIGGVSLPCFVLDDGRRVISGRGLTSAIGMKGRGQGAARVSSHKLIKHYKNNELSVAIESPIKFIGRSPKGDSVPSDGFEATILQEVCEAILTARDLGLVSTDQDRRYAVQADILMRGFARVGIIALIDEATGYQDVRDRQALQAILDKYLKKELAAWAKRFPDEFYKQIFRLRGWQWSALKRPGVVAAYTKDFVYSRLAPGVLEELERKNPVTESGRRKAKHHQWLTEDVGHPALAQHLHAIIGLMRASDTWEGFKALADRAFPKRGSNLELEL